MSQANVLNDDPLSLLNFDYGYRLHRPHPLETFWPASGRPFARQQLARGHVYRLNWRTRPMETVFQLQQWAEQYSAEKGFFTLRDHERARYFSGFFDPTFAADGALDVQVAGFRKYNVEAAFLELPGAPMHTYPSDWARDAVFLEERNEHGDDLVKLDGTWNYLSDSRHHGGAALSNANTGTTDAATWLYFGYGYRLWATKGPDLGQFQLTARRLRTNAPVTGPGTIDLYNATQSNSGVVWTEQSLPLDWYLVEIKAKNTKHASSSGLTIFADALEVMR